MLNNVSWGYHGELGKVPYVIDQEKCIKCGQCIKACHFNVIERK